MLVFLGWTTDYDQLMVEELKSHLNASSINFPEGRFFFRINVIFKYKLIRYYLKLRALFLPKDAILIYKDSDGYGYHRNLDVFKNDKYLIVRNLIEHYKANEFKASFARIFSFDSEQCKNFGFEHMPQIFPLNEQQVCIEYSKVQNNCYFVGLNKNRISAINSIGEIIEEKGIKCEFYVLNDNSGVVKSKYLTTKKISYIDNLRNVRKCNYVLEINQDGQVGLTLRALEALFHGKKLISNNFSLKSYSFYDESRVFLFNDPNDFKSKKFDSFVSSKFLSLQSDELKTYTALSFFSCLFNNKC